MKSGLKKYKGMFLGGVAFLLLASSVFAVVPLEIDNVLNQTIVRQKQVLASQVASTYPPAGLWRHEDFALAAYWLDTDTAVADAELVAIQTNGLYQAEIDAHGFHWHAYLQARIYFLFSSQSDFFPGRMSTNAENAILEMLWDWAAPSCDIDMASPDHVNWVWGSENHHAQSWVSFWSAAQIFKDHPDYQNLTYADGSTPAQMADAFDEYFKAYATQYATKGLPIEVASPTYAKYTLNTWYNLYDFADDPVLKECMDMLLNTYWADWALEQIDGVRGGSRHRCYSGASSITLSGGAEAAWFQFGVGTMSSHPGAMSAATTFWRPSRAVVGLVLDTEGRGSYEYTSRRMGLAESGADNQFIQDPNHPYYGGVYTVDTDGGALLRYSWCTPTFVMGTSQMEPLTRNDWTAISSQNRWNGVIFGGHATARIFTQPYKPAAGSVYNAEWGVQHKGVQMLQRLQESNANGQQVWFDSALTLTETNGWIFAEAPQAYAAVRVVNGSGTWQTDTNFPAQGQWFDLTDETSPVIIEVVPTNEVAGFAAFQTDVLNNTLIVTGTQIDYTSSFYDTTLTLFLDESTIPQVDGVPLDFSPIKAYDSPYLQGSFDGETVIINYGPDRTVLGEQAIIVENSAVHYDGNSGTSNNILPNFTVGEGVGRKLVASINYESASALDGITYAGESLTKAVDSGSNSRGAQIWYLDSPTVGTANLVATFTGNVKSLLCAVSLQNAAEGGPIVSNAVLGAGAWINELTTTEPNTFVIGTYTENNAVAITNLTFETTLFMGNSGSSVSHIGYQTEAVAGLKTYIWSHNETSGGSAVAGFGVLPLPEPPPKVVGVVNSAMNYDGDSGAPSNTISGFTVDAGNDRKLVLSINSETAGTISSITYGGQSFTQAVQNVGSGRLAQIWYLDDPAVGTADIVATYTANGRSRMGVMSLQNAADGVSVVNAVASGATSLGLTTTNANTLVIGSYIENGSAAITGPFASTLYSGDSGSSAANSGYQNELVAGPKTYAWVGGETGGIALAGFAVAPDAILLYVAWSAAYGLTNGTESLTADPDFDQMNNLAEYGLGGNPTSNDAAGIGPTSSLDAGLLAYVYNRRRDAAERGLAYTVEADTNLVSASWTTNGVAEAGSAVLDADFEMVTNTVPIDVDAKFLRLQIEMQEMN